MCIATQLEMEVKDEDYLKILKGGNFFHFVAIAYSAADELSMIKTKNYRLKVSRNDSLNATGFKFKFPPHWEQ